MLAAQQALAEAALNAEGASAALTGSVRITSSTVMCHYVLPPFLNDLHAATALALLTMVGTGLFQEEAYFAPLALAMILALAGMIVGAAVRSGLLDRPVAD